MRWFRRKKDLVDPDDRSPELGLKYKDLHLLGELMKQGANLDQGRHVLHYLYLPSKAAADEAAEEVGRQGWQTSVRKPLPDYPDQWLALCEQHNAVLTPDFVRDATDLMEVVAARHGGEYDGWEASV